MILRLSLRKIYTIPGCKISFVNTDRLHAVIIRLPAQQIAQSHLHFLIAPGWKEYVYANMFRIKNNCGGNRRTLKSL